MKDKVGGLLRAFLAELGVEVVPVSEDGPTSGWRQSFDALVMPHFMNLSQRAAKGREELAKRLETLHSQVQAQLGKLPQVPFPLGYEPGPLYEPFAKIGLLFTSNLDAGPPGLPQGRRGRRLLGARRGLGGVRPYILDDLRLWGSGAPCQMLGLTPGELGVERDALAAEGAASRARRSGSPG